MLKTLHQVREASACNASPVKAAVKGGLPPIPKRYEEEKEGI